MCRNFVSTEELTITGLARQFILKDNLNEKPVNVE